MDDAQGRGAVEHAAEAPTSVKYGQALQGVSAIIAPATLLTGIAFYFGWQRVRSFDAYVGLNPGAVGLSTRDYVLNSLGTLFLPVVVVLIALIVLALGHAYVTDAQRACSSHSSSRSVSSGPPASTRRRSVATRRRRSRGTSTSCRR